MASASCFFVKIAGPYLDEIPGKRVWMGLMAFAANAGYDRTDLPKVHGGPVGVRPRDVFDGCMFIDQMILCQVGSDQDNNQANQPGQGTGMAKAEFLPATQEIKLWNVGSFFNATVQARDEVEMATDVAAAFPLTDMSFIVKVICGA